MTNLVENAEYGGWGKLDLAQRFEHEKLTGTRMAVNPKWWAKK